MNGNLQINNADDFFNTVFYSQVVPESFESGGYVVGSSIGSGWDSAGVITTNAWPEIEYVHEIPIDVKIYEDKYPPLNVWIHEETRDLLLEFAVAGIPRDKISIEFDGDKLRLEIEAHSEEKEGYKRSQKGIRGSSSKTWYTVPQEKFDTSEAKAGLSDGILSIHIPAREDQRPRKLLIEN